MIFNSSSLDAMIAPLQRRQVREAMNFTSVFDVSRVSAIGIDNYNRVAPAGPVALAINRCHAAEYGSTCPVLCHVWKAPIHPIDDPAKLSAIEKTVSRECRPPQRDSCDEPPVLLEYANCSCARINGRCRVISVIHDCRSHLSI